MKNSILKFKKYFIFIFVFVLLSFPTPVFSQSDSSILDRQDEFFLALPFNGQSISGKQKVAWKMVDAEQGKIPFELNLLDSNCISKIGTIAGNTGSAEIAAVPSITAGFYIYEWDTAGALSDLPKVEDGSYCLELKSTFLNGATPYVLSSKNKISIQNKNNHTPEITSELPKLNIKTGEQFSYQVKAQDEDSDTLKYNLISSPSWLSINNDSGLLNGMTETAGAYPIVVNAEDGKGGFFNQSFSVNVSSNTPSVLAFSSPKSSTVFSGQANEIIWQSDDSEGIKRQIVEYSNNGVSWVLVSQMDKTAQKASWDVRTLFNGEYFLRISVIDENDIKSQLVSEKFVVANDPGTNIENTSSIYNLSPLRNSSVSDKLEKISGNFLIGEKNIKVESVQVFFDGIEITKDCVISASAFECSMTKEPEGGLHKVKVVFENESGETIEEEWSFSTEGQSITETPTNNSNGGLEINPNSIILIVGIICAVLLLLFIPWVIYLIWAKKNKEDGDVEPLTEFKEPLPYKEPETFEPEVYPTEPKPGDEYAIGSQNIEGALEEDFNITELKGSEQPTWLTEEQNIDIDKASRPVTSEGKAAPVEEIDDQSNITQPHGLQPLRDNGDS